MYVHTAAFLDICRGQTDDISIFVYRLTPADVRKGQLETRLDIFKYDYCSLIFAGAGYIISRR